MTLHRWTISARDMGYHPAGMPVDTVMLIGMGLIIIGLFAALFEKEYLGGKGRDDDIPLHTCLYG